MKNLLLSAIVAASLYGTNIDMVQGWNLVGFNSDVNISNSELVTGDVNTVWKYANQDWQLHTNMNIDTNIEIMTTIGRSEGVWVNATNAFTFEQSTEQNIESHTVNLTTGWNLVSTPFAMDINASEYFTAENVNVVWKYTEQDWSLYSNMNIETTITSFETINAGEGYWVYAKNDFSVTFINPDYVVTGNDNEDTNVIEETVVDDVNTTDEIVTEEVNDETEETVNEEETTTVPSTYVLAKNLDTTDSDNDGMTDVAELKYGFDPYDASSFPNTDPEVIVETPNEKLPLEINGFDGAYVIEAINGLIIGMDTSILGENESATIRITHGEEVLKYASFSDDTEIRYDEYNLVGSETLTVELGTYSYDTQEYTDFDPIQLNLSNYNLKVIEAGNSENKISYTFNDFTEENEAAYRSFLQKVWPIMYDRLGVPAESLNTVIDYIGPDSPYFISLDHGRTMMTTQELLPRLIVHEFIHNWKGRFTIVSDEDWDYATGLEGFEEGLAEGMAFEIMQDYAKAYPNDEITQNILTSRSYEYNDQGSSHYDLIKTQRNTSGNNFKSASVSGITNRYSTASATVATILSEYPNFHIDVMTRMYDKINADSTWRPNRADILDIWVEVAPTVLGIDMETYINALPVFDSLEDKEDGVYILTSTRAYNNGYGPLYVAATYSLDGYEWWNLQADDINSSNIPEGVNYAIAGEWVYSDQQFQDYTINVKSGDTVIDTLTGTTDGSYAADGRPESVGWENLESLDETSYELGFYGMEVTFDNLTQFNGSTETFYFFSHGTADINEEVLTVFVGTSIEADNLTMTLEIDGVSKTVEVNNNLGLFELPEVEQGYEGTLNITVENDDQTCTYQRALLDTMRHDDRPELGFVIIDTDFNCVEDIYEN